MTPLEIITDLKSRGERQITFFEDGTIVSLHGQHTVNYWSVTDGKLICTGCRTIGY